jgi:hypothetical protein
MYVYTTDPGSLPNWEIVISNTVRHTEVSAAQWCFWQAQHPPKNPYDKSELKI